ncbi:GspH/FimT family protein [Ramlibacter tataouinensis]|uniref:GspH/FimT family pseudopilin n=1 Tax=Ramlibacter tataouinensis TaxID=94132 RepID=UPI0022F3BE1A|nr:GspH/FimT family protein [Ramlibacter tataouinensis]WBY01582.1 GspH/FimT family protein [Ramlibacter tataouinensis]
MDSPAGRLGLRVASRRAIAARGFTLVELLVAIALTALLAGLAAPAMTAMTRSVRLTSAANDLFASLLIARSEAVKRAGRVTLCKSADGRACSATGGWEQGWIVFHDTGGLGTREAGEHVLLHAQPLDQRLRLSGNLNVARYVSFTASGATALASGAFQAGTITMCHASMEGSEGRQIVLSASGRARAQRKVLDRCPA